MPITSKLNKSLPQALTIFSATSFKYDKQGSVVIKACIEDNSIAYILSRIFISTLSYTRTYYSNDLQVQLVAINLLPSLLINKSISNSSSN